MSIHKLPSGNWRAKVRVGDDQRWVSRSFPTKADALKQLKIWGVTKKRKPSVFVSLEDALKYPRGNPGQYMDLVSMNSNPKLPVTGDRPIPVVWTSQPELLKAAAQLDDGESIQVRNIRQGRLLQRYLKQAGKFGLLRRLSDKEIRVWCVITD